MNPIPNISHASTPGNGHGTGDSGDALSKAGLALPTSVGTAIPNPEK
jgi:hypothetical protein